jgi:hypothetical protein
MLMTLWDNQETIIVLQNILGITIHKHIINVEESFSIYIPEYFLVVPLKKNFKIFPFYSFALPMTQWYDLIQYIIDF